MTSQMMFMHPPVEAARSYLYGELFAWEGVITKLPRLQHSRYQVVELTIDFHSSIGIV
jgi:hypothetical protein